MDRRANHIETRKHPQGSLDYFPTPPWATRALLHELLIRQCGVGRAMSVRDPCVGGGHMLPPLKEVFGRVDYSDVADWGIAPPIRDFTFETADSLIADGLEIPDWIIMNPPFDIAPVFFANAYAIAREGVAMLLRLGWMAGQKRYNAIFGPTPPTYICPFAERVAMIEGVWDPEVSTATDYAWFVWVKPAPEMQWGSLLKHFRPGMENRYSRLSDMELATPGEGKRRAEARKAKEKAGAA
jgi:hypothetical protein